MLHKQSRSWTGRRRKLNHTHGPFSGSSCAKSGTKVPSDWALQCNHMYTSCADYRSGVKFIFYLYGTWRFSAYSDSNLGSLLRETTVRMFSMASVAICWDKTCKRYINYRNAHAYSYRYINIYIIPTFPAASNSFLSLAACPASSLISAAPANAMTGTTAKMSRVSSQP